MQSKDPRFHALPVASQRVASFTDTVNELVYDVLISKVRQRLSDVSRLPIWSSVEEQGSFPLPTFSAYPQSYVTSVGEYLLTLPQQLEPLAEGISNNEVNDEAQFFASCICACHVLENGGSGSGNEHSLLPKEAVFPSSLLLLFARAFLFLFIN